MTKKIARRRNALKPPSKRSTPVMKYFIGDQFKPSILLLGFFSKNYGTTTLEFKIDESLFGIVGFERHHIGISKVLATYSDTEDFYQVTREAFVERLARGCKISQSLGTIQDPTLLEWIERLGISRVKVKGSLYRCHRCRRWELPEATVNYIIDLAKAEMERPESDSRLRGSIRGYCEKCTLEREKEKLEQQSTEVLLAEIPALAEEIRVVSVSQIAKDLARQFEPTELERHQNISLGKETELYKVGGRRGPDHWYWSLTQPKSFHYADDFPIDIPVGRLFFYSADEQSITVFPSAIQDLEPWILNTPIGEWKKNAVAKVKQHLKGLNQIQDGEKRFLLMLSAWHVWEDRQELRDVLSPIIYGDVIQKRPGHDKIKELINDYWAGTLDFSLESFHSVF